MAVDVENAIKLFAQTFSPHTYKKNEILFHPGQPINTAFYLKHGYVKMYGVSTDGVETTIHIFIPGSYFPMISIIGQGENKYYFEALSPVQGYIIPKDQLIAFLKKHPEVLFDLTSRIVTGLEKLVFRMEQLTHEKAEKKVASSLLYLAKHFGEDTGGEITIQEVFTHKDIASLAGMTRETASRAWKKLEKNGIVRYHKRNIIVSKPDQLT